MLPYKLPLTRPESGGIVISLSRYELQGKKKDAGSFKERLSGNKVTGTATAHLEWGAVDTIEIFVDVAYKLVLSPAIGAMPLPSSGSFSLSARWWVTYTDRGIVLEKDGIQPKDSKKKKKGLAGVTAVAPLMAQNNKRPRVEFGVDLVAVNDQKGVSIGIGNKITIGIEVGGGRKTSTLETHYTLDLKVNVPPDPKKEAPAKPDVKIPLQLTKHLVQFDFNDDRVRQDQKSALKKWVDEIKSKAEPLYHAIGGGKILLRVTGHASEEGNEKLNLKLSKKRVAQVISQLEKSECFNSKKLFLMPLPLGEKEARKKKSKWKDKPDKSDLKVVVEFSRQEAAAAIKTLAAATR